MTLEIPSRRGFITGLIAFAATAPAIVRAGSLMPVKMLEDIPFCFLNGVPIYQDLIDITRRTFVPRLFVQLHVASPFSRLLEDLRNE